MYEFFTAFTEDMSKLRLSGLSVRIRIAETSIAEDPAVAIIFADPIAGDLDRLILFDSGLHAIVAKILACEEEEDEEGCCQHLLKSSLIALETRENIPKEEPLDDQLLKEEQEEEIRPDGDSDHFSDHQNNDAPHNCDEDRLLPPLPSVKENLNLIKPATDCLSWPYQKVTNFTNDFLRMIS
jgi:hypothetical protein